MRFHIQGQSYQFKALPFGLSTAPMEFAVVAKEVKLMALQIVLGIGLKNQSRLIGNSEQSIIDYNRFSACFVRKTEYSFLPNIITVVFR